MSDDPRIPGKPVIKKKDIEVDRIRASGPGGQNRNKRFTGIRMVHKETGIVVNATERRSQSQNLSHAFERLEKKLEVAAHRPKRRRKSKPGRGAVERRIKSKKKHGEKKKNRKDGWD